MLGYQNHTGQVPRTRIGRMTGDPLFSVIITAYGRPQLLREAVDSVLAQTVPDFECVVVDDGSPTPVEVHQDVRVRLVRRQNGGPAAARNTGLNAARGRHVTFLDDDDLFAPNRLELALEGLTRAPVATCWWRNLDEHPDVPSHPLILEGDVSDTILENEIPPFVAACAVERVIVPRFDERFRVSEDKEWWVRLSQTSPVATVPKIGFLHRRHQGPRLTDSIATRLGARLLLLEVHAEYFATRPRAAAHQWVEVGLLAQRLGHHDRARAALRRSFRLRPSMTTLLYLVRSLRPTRVDQTGGSDILQALRR